MSEEYDVVVIGAGAAGMMCAIEAGKRGRRVLVLDHAAAPGEKIRISGGGRCNFTNIHTSPKNFLSGNPHFCKSALARYTPQDFLALVESHGIAWHEKTLGQLFCNESAKDIVSMLTTEMSRAGVVLRLATSVGAVSKTEARYAIEGGDVPVTAASLVIATGGKSIPKMGATGFAYKIADDFGLPLVETRPGLVPLTLDAALLDSMATLSGVAVPVRAGCGRTAFEEALLITHRGLSGPAVLQISSYWREGAEIVLQLAPDVDLEALLKEARTGNGRQALQTALSETLPKRLATFLVERAGLANRPLADLSNKAIDDFVASLKAWTIRPAGSEGYRTAEVTLGGVDTRALDSRTFEARNVPGLHFIGECVDVTGWLGGYNFQWAWASGFCAGQVV